MTNMLRCTVYKTFICPWSSKWKW